MSEEKEKPKEKAPEEDRPPKISALEWFVSILSIIAVAGVVAILIHEHMTETQPTPVLTIHVDKIEKQGEHFLAAATARNDGDKTASRLECLARLTGRDNAVEEHMARIEFLPPHSTKRIGFVFSRDPREGDLKVAPGGYEER